MANKAFVGLLPGTINKDGEDVVNIGAVMEYSAAIKHPNGTTNILPAILILHPVMEKYLEQILQNYREAVRSVFCASGTFKAFPVVSYIPPPIAW